MLQALPTLKVGAARKNGVDFLQKINAVLEKVDPPLEKVDAVLK